MKIYIAIYIKDRVARTISTKCSFLPRAGELIMIDNKEHYVADIVYAEKKGIFSNKHIPTIMVIPENEIPVEKSKKKLITLFSAGWIASIQ